MTYRMNMGQTQRSIGYAWLIEGLREKILVDAGASARYLSVVRGIPATKIQSVESGLGKLGLDPSDIDLVIFSHLHNDHVAEARRFTKARLLVQRSELEFAERPHPSVSAAYHQEFIDGLHLEVLDGDTRICDEISVLFTPGHTPGGQSVRVRTAKGAVIISGLCTISEIFNPPPSLARWMPVITPGMHVNVMDAYDSTLRIKEQADIIIANHDPEYQEKDTIP